MPALSFFPFLAILTLALLSRLERLKLLVS
jgi:hypothetical protein